MKLSEALNIHHVISQILDTETQTDHRIKFRMLGILYELEGPMKNFQQIRNEKIKEYGVQDADGNISIDARDTETLEKFNQDMQELLLEELPAPISRLRAADLFDSGLHAGYLVELYPIIEDE